MTYAILDQSDRCTAIVTTEPAAGVRWVKAGADAAVGRIWTGWEFRSPRWTSYEFLRRFSSGEREAIRVAAAGDSAVADLLMFLQTSTEVVSDDTTTDVGLAYLVHLGIITEARKAELLKP